MNNVVLIGDSIFDNATYVPEKQAVIDHLKKMLPVGTTVTILAIDGSITSQVIPQLERLPSGASHIFVSSGGNDALRAKFQIFDADTGLGVISVLQDLATYVSEFRKQYHRLMNEIGELSLPTSVCTIYDSIPSLEDAHKTALSAFNDVIVQEAATKGFLIIDLRQVCIDEDDYSAMSPIEPSGKGGKKIADRIALVLKEHDFKRKRTVIY